MDRDDLRIELIPNESTYVVVVSISNDPAKNRRRTISSGAGIPLGGYIYNASDETYQVQCFDFMRLGLIPVAYKATMANQYRWNVKLPLPERLILEYLTDSQRQDLEIFRRSAELADCRIEYIQMQSCF